MCFFKQFFLLRQSAPWRGGLRALSAVVLGVARQSVPVEGGRRDGMFLDSWSLPRPLSPLGEGDFASCQPVLELHAAPSPGKGDVATRRCWMAGHSPGRCVPLGREAFESGDSCSSTEIVDFPLSLKMTTFPRLYGGNYDARKKAVSRIVSIDFAMSRAAVFFDLSPVLW